MAVFGTDSSFADMKISTEALFVEPYTADASTLTLSANHAGRTILLSRAAGCDVTLPSATGTGNVYKFIVATTVTSNDYTVVCAGSDEYAGVIYQVDTDTTDTVAAYPALAADNFDTITLNGGTTGGLAGDWIEIMDVATGVWALRGNVNGSGTVASPLSAA